MRPRSYDSFSGFLIRELAVVATFFCGTWAIIGVDPNAFPIRFIAQYFHGLLYEPSIGMFYWVIPIPVLMLAIMAAIAYGGLFDLLGLALAFAGGYFIGGPMGIMLLIVGMVVGLIAPVSAR